MSPDPGTGTAPVVHVDVPDDWCFMAADGSERCPDLHAATWPKVRPALVAEMSNADGDRIPVAAWLGRRDDAYLHGGVWFRQVPRALRVDEWAATVRQAERDNLLSYEVWRHATGLALRAVVRRRDAAGLMWYAVDHYFCGIDGFVVDLRTLVAGLPTAHPTVEQIFADTDTAARTTAIWLPD